jgi:hypothetical protein
MASIGARIALAIAAVLAGLLGVIGAVFGLQQVERNIAELVTVGNVKSDAASQMRLAIVSRVDAVRNVALTSEVNAMQGDLKRIDDFAKVYAERRKQMLDLAPTEPERAALAKADAAEPSRAAVQAGADAGAHDATRDVGRGAGRENGSVQRQWMAALMILPDRPKPDAAVLAAAQTSRRQTLIGMRAGVLAFVVGS